MHSESTRISEEPLIRAIHRRIVEIVFVIYAAFLAYISVVPFDLIGTPPPHSAPGFFFGIAVTGGNVPDIFVNIGIYLPLGALGWIVCRRLKLGRITAAAPAVLFAGLLSFAIEYGQRWIGSRVSSWVDVIANLLGAGMGVALLYIWSEPLRRLLDQGRASAQRNWWSAAAKATVCLLLVLHLRPYDVVVDIRHTAASLVRHADLSPVAAWNGLPEKVQSEINVGRRKGMPELSRVKWEYALDRIAEIAAYAALTVMLTLGLNAGKPNRKTLRTYAWAGFVVVSLAMIVTVIRIFLITHGLDTAHVCSGVLGWLIGCAAAWRMSPSANRSSRFTLPLGLIRLAVVVALALSVLYELVPFDFKVENDVTKTSEGLFSSIPFALGFKSRPNDAFYDITGEMLRYGAIAICIAVSLSRWTRWRWRLQLTANVLLTAAACVVFEATHLIMESRHADVTTVLIAMFASFTGMIAVRWMVDYRQYLSVTVANDLLTSQLIDGESYDKNRELRTAKRENVKSMTS
ncbi:MAG: VanZ family protein [Phycisphaerales bacterium]|nr:VanZ family protein [Phycisphaerales bacterium]